MGDASGFSGIFFCLLSWWLFPPSPPRPPRSLCLRHTVTFMAFGLCIEVDKLVKGSWELGVR